ncbi:Bug family tripartite tricarboxylate transporter substrate binding protein [Muricoccus vinaceus]|uniref:Bug family tripartite tricarboxylate transporter substrate binding protein n=1 Tax=Muricoccus vinaceus TaxID=424704 RepID=A0ABV6IQE4_9PROT
MKRRYLLGAASASWLSGLRGGVAQASFPTQPIRFVVPFTPGGSNDVVARLIGEQLSPRWGQPFVVENRPGASGNIGAEAVARATPDGHTWLLGANQIFTTNPHLVRAAFDPLRDFSFVAMVARVPVVLVVHAALGARDVRELVALARQRPGSLTYPSTGVGSSQHLGVARLVGENATHVPYRGANALMPDLIAGRLQIYTGAVNSLLAHIRSGSVRALASMGTDRVPALPDVPTIGEAGFPDAQTQIWLSIAVPAAVPRPIVDQIHTNVAEVMQMSSTRLKLDEQGIEVAIQGPTELEATVRAEYARDGALIAKLGIRE